MVRVLVAEDSPTARQLLVEILADDPEIEVVGEARDGAEAVELTRKLRPDLVTMDVHMPLMDGLEATRRIMTATPTPIVIVSSSSSAAEVELSLNAMRAGALMVLSKPEGPGAPRFDGRRAQLVSMVKAMSGVKVVRRRARPEPAVPVPPARAAREAGPVRLIAIAASTGGPVALHRILRALPADFPVPIVVVQHIAAGFVAGLAEWLSASCRLHVGVAEQRAVLAGGTVLLAPDDRHLGVGGDGRVILSDSPAINGLRPSATHLFTSAARSYGASAAAVILTGMGDDGVEGLSDIRAAGGRVLAQDEATSVVYGMPREAVAAGVVDEVLPLEDLARRFVTLARRGSSDAPNPGR